MKIALVCPYNMFDRPGGVPQLVINLHAGLVKKGHQVKIITQRPSGYKGEIPKDYIVIGTTRNFKGGFGTHGNWGMPSDSDEIAQVLNDEKFDVINFHEPWIPMLAWQMLKDSTAAHVGTFHANLVDAAAGKYWINMFLPYGRGIGQKMHVFTAVSDAPASVIINKTNNSEVEKKLIKNLKYIPNGIDLNYYKPFKKRLPLNGPNTKTIVYVGRLERRKGVEHLIKAFASLSAKMPKAYLIIAGEGGLRKQLEQQVKFLKLENVHFAGYINDEEKRRLMGNADVFCAPSMFGESFGIVLLEAMATGTPVVAGRNIGYSNVLSGRGRLGLVDAKSIDDFADRLAVFLSDDKTWSLMRGWSLQTVKQYNYPRIVGLYEQAYKEAINLASGVKNGSKDAKKQGLINRVFVRRHT